MGEGSDRAVAKQPDALWRRNALETKRPRQAASPLPGLGDA